MARTVEQIEKEIAKLEYDMFIEEMADFINWGYYRELENRIEELKKELEEAKSK